jgi:Bacterial Ig domain
MNRQLNFRGVIVKSDVFSCTLVNVIIAFFLLFLPAGAQFAPTSLAFPSNITWQGTSIDSNDGLVSESANLQIISASTFSASPAGGGTYAYSKTGPNTGTLTYVFNYSEPGYTETENGTVLLTFTSTAAGTFVSSGSYSGNDLGDPFSGSFTNGMGTFSYVVPNTAPTVSNVTDKSTNEDTATSAIAFTIGDTTTDPASLVVTRNSSNTILVPLANILLGGSGASRSVTISPAANQTGTSTITLTVGDGVFTTSDTFVLTVNAVNDAPTITDVGDQATSEDNATTAISFTVGDIETTATSLVVTRNSSNTTLIPLANVVLGGSGASRTVTVTPVANQFGTSTITLAVSDGTLIASDTFVLTVSSVNDVPTITNVTDKSTPEDTATVAIPFTVGDVETDPSSLTLSSNSSNLTLVPLANIALGGSGASRTVTISPAANQSGSSTITLTVSDGSLTASDTFNLTVTAVNDVPTISDTGNLTIVKNTATNVLAFTISDVETTAGSLTVTRASSNLTLVPLVNVVLAGSGASRTVTITPAANQTGTSTITLTVSDGTASANDTFVLNVIDGLTISNWRQTHFSTTANSGDGADLNDFDFDGRVNLMEYALGSLPKNPTITNVPAIATETFSGQSYLTMTITKPSGIQGITYVVEVSNSLTGWSSGPANTTVIIDDAATLKVRDNTSIGGGQRFIRLKVTNP